jgi:hypothetical protein
MSISEFAANDGPLFGGRRGEARRGRARQGAARLGVAGRGVAWRGPARQGKARSSGLAVRKEPPVSFVLSLPRGDPSMARIMAR